MRTIRKTKLDKAVLRLVEKDNRFIGIVVGGNVQVEGDLADDVWRRLHDEAGKANPKYFGFDGARARFLGFFPKGFHSAGYARQERNYKIAAKKALDAVAPLDRAAGRVRFGEAILSVFRRKSLSERRKFELLLPGTKG